MMAAAAWQRRGESSVVERVGQGPVSTSNAPGNSSWSKVEAGLSFLDYEGGLGMPSFEFTIWSARSEDGVTIWETIGEKENDVDMICWYVGWKEEEGANQVGKYVSILHLIQCSLKYVPGWWYDKYKNYKDREHLCSWALPNCIMSNYITGAFGNWMQFTQATATQVVELIQYKNCHMPHICPNTTPTVFVVFITNMSQESELHGISAFG